MQPAPPMPDAPRSQGHWSIRLLCGGLVAALQLTTACDGGRPEAIEPIRIGVLVPESGSLGDNGPEWTRAAVLAAEQINSAGGLFDGREIVLDIRDSETDGSIAAGVAQSLVDDGASVVVGPAGSGVVRGTQPILAAAEVPQLTCCATDPTLTDEQANRAGWLFRTTPNDRYQAQAMAYVATRGVNGPHPEFIAEFDAPEGGVISASCPEMVLAYQDNDYGLALAQNVAANYVGQTIYERDENGDLVEMKTPGGETARGRLLFEDDAWPDDFTFGVNANDPSLDAMADEYMGRVFAAMSANHDTAWNPRVCVLFMGYGGDGAQLVEAFIRGESDFNTTNGILLDRQLMGSDGLNEDSFVSGAGDLAAQVLGFVPTHASNEAYTKFAGAFSARFDNPPEAFTSQMFDAVMMAGLAITAGESTEGAVVRDQLFEVSNEGFEFDGRFYGEIAARLLAGDDVDYIGPSGPLDFDDSGDVIGDYALWQVVRINDQNVIKNTDFLPAADFIP